MEDILYTAEELSKLFKCSVGRVNDLRKAGLLPALKLGCFKYRRVAVEKFLEEYEGKDVTDPFNVQELRGAED